MAAHAEKERLDRWRKSDFYAVLGLAPSATISEVKKGFRKVALTCHPDKVPPEDRERATRHFQLIAEAYEVLSNEASRSKYDSVRPRGTPVIPNGFGYSQPKPPSAPSAEDKAREAARLAKQKADAAAYHERIKKRWGGNESKEPFGAPPKDPFEGGWHRCDGCDTRCQLADLRNCSRCPDRHSAGLLCKNCDMCAGCIPDDIYRQVPPRYKPPQAPPRGNVPRDQPQNVPRAEPRKSADQNVSEERPYFQKRPLYEDLTEFWERVPGGNAKAASNSPANHSSASKAAPVRVTAAESRRGATNAPIQRHDRAPTPEPEEELDNLGILMAMGFEERRAKAALLRCSSVEAAVQYMMEQGEPGVYSEYIEPVVRPAAQGIYGAAERAGVAPAANQAASALHGVVKPAAQGLYGVAERAYGAVIQPVAQRIYGESETPGGATSDLPATLLALGFSEKQATEAAGRCSSVEAAVEWIAAHPELGG